MSYKFDLLSINKSKYILDKWIKGVPKGKQPKDIWKNPISTTPNSGHRNELFSKNMGIVDHRGTAEEAYYALMKYAEDNKDKEPKERGLRESDIWYWANYMKTEVEAYSKVTYPLETYFEFIVAYYVVGAFRAFNAEYEFCDWINYEIDGSICYSDETLTEEMCRKFDCKSRDELDRTLMVDLVVETEGTIDAIQIKNLTFLKGGEYSSYEKDLNELKTAYKKVTDMGYGYFFAFYSSDGGWLENKNHICLFEGQRVFDFIDKYTKKERKEIIDDNVRWNTKNDYRITELR